MSVGMVVEQAVAKPEDPVHSEIGTKPRLDIVPGQARIAVGN
jgi:hypothetical protein